MIKTFAAWSYKLLALLMLAKLQPEFGHCAFGMHGMHGLTRPCALWCFSAVASCCYGPDFSAQSSHPKVASCTLTVFNTHGRLAQPTAKKHGSPVSEVQIFTCQRLPELPDRAGFYRAKWQPPMAFQPSRDRFKQIHLSCPERCLVHLSFKDNRMLRNLWWPANVFKRQLATWNLCATLRFNQHSHTFCQRRKPSWDDQKTWNHGMCTISTGTHQSLSIQQKFKTWGNLEITSTVLKAGTC